MPLKYTDVFARHNPNSVIYDVKVVILIHDKLMRISFCFLLLLCSCARRSLYIPVSQNVPLFNKNKQVIADAYLALNHVELQTAFNPTSHFAVAGNVNFGSGIAIYDAACGSYGYNQTGKWRYELFAGYGHNSNITYPTTSTNFFTKDKISYEVNARYNKYYIQPAIGYFNEIWIYKINYSFSLSARLSYNHFNDFLYREVDEKQTTDPNNPVYIVNKQYSHKNLFLLEPCITNKVGIKNLYGIIQVQGMIPYSNEIDVSNTKFSPGFLWSFGLQYNLRFKPNGK
jgi:hypothetical protein